MSEELCEFLALFSGAVFFGLLIGELLVDLTLRLTRQKGVSRWEK